MPLFAFAFVFVFVFVFIFVFIFYSPAASTTDQLPYRFDGFIS